ncbi:MAG: DnaB-like helicase N-terminal domain-containing protein, partial [Steroidobacteraceae bacterium]
MNARGGEVRTPPHSIEAEQSVLGGLLLDSSAWDNVADAVRSADFYRPDHAALFALLGEMSAAGDPIEPVTVQERVCRGRAGLHSHPADRYGGIAYVVELPDQAPSTANLDYYARRIALLARLRRAGWAAWGAV